MRKRKEKGRGRVGALLAAGVLGHGLRAFTDCVFAQLSWQVESDGCLHLTTGDGVLLVVVGEPRGLGGDALEDVVDEGVHDAHGLAGDPSVGVDLLQDLVDVDRVALLAAPPLLLLSFARGLGFGGGCLLLAFGGSNLSWHGRFVEKASEKTMRRMMNGWECRRGGFYLAARDHFSEDRFGSDQSDCSVRGRAIDRDCGGPRRTASYNKPTNQNPAR